MLDHLEQEVRVWRSPKRSGPRSRPTSTSSSGSSSSASSSRRSRTSWARPRADRAATRTSSATSSREKRDDLPEAVVETLEKELTKLARTNPASPEYGVVRNYVETILDLPWDHTSDDKLDIARAEVLDEDHYGLDDVKKRILEYLAVSSSRAT